MAVHGGDFGREVAVAADVEALELAVGGVIVAGGLAGLSGGGGGGGVVIRGGGGDCGWVIRGFLSIPDVGSDLVGDLHGRHLGLDLAGRDGHHHGVGHLEAGGGLRGGRGRRRGIEERPLLRLPLGELELALLDLERALSLLVGDALPALREVELEHRELELLLLHLQLPRSLARESPQRVGIHLRDIVPRRRWGRGRGHEHRAVDAAARQDLSPGHGVLCETLASSDAVFGDAVRGCDLVRAFTIGRRTASGMKNAFVTRFLNRGYER